MSASVSPFAADVAFDVANPTTFPPSLFIADSKDNLVLVLGSKNNVAKIFPFRRLLFFSPLATGSISLDTFIIYSTSALDKSLIEIMSLPSKTCFIQIPFSDMVLTYFKSSLTSVE